ncbi:MAG: hypothetical protein WA139_05475 [Candidatus Aenigmatarchaeota archaeon]
MKRLFFSCVLALLFFTGLSYGYTEGSGGSYSVNITRIGDLAVSGSTGSGGGYSVNISAIGEIGGLGSGGGYSVRISQQQAPLSASAGSGGGYSVIMGYVRVAYIDNVQPLITIQLPQNATYKSTYVNLNYTVADENLAACWYSLDFGANASLDNCQNSTLLSLSAGSHLIRVYANDTDGNQNVSLAWFLMNTTAGNVTVRFAVHLGTAFADDSIQGDNNYACVSDSGGWFGLAGEAPTQTLYSNLTNDYNITVVQGAGNKLYIGASRGNCNKFRDSIGSIMARTFLAPLKAFAYPATNLIQLILPFNTTDITNDAHWGKGTYLLSIANRGYNASSGNQMLAVNVVK